MSAESRPEFQEELGWLYSTQLFGIKLGLENVRRLLEALGLPDAGARVLHVAGTNGKGSTCAFLDSLCRAGGWRTGLFTSPHLVSFTERIRVDGVPIPEEEAAVRIRSLRERVAGWENPPTFFELTLALALDWFRACGVQIIVLETGMGGRLDATNAVPSAVSVITPVDYDHMQWLGDTLEKIAAEKAGIIKPGVPVISAPQAPEAAAVIAATALEKNAPLTVVEYPLDGWELGLSGPHQRWNAALALAALQAAQLVPFKAALREALRDARWPGRFQRVGGAVIDGAHNPHGARALVEAWREAFGGAKTTVIFGAVALKNHAAILDILEPLAGRWIFTTVRSPRAVPAAELAAARPGATVTADLGEALALVQGAGDAAVPYLVCGSLYLAGEAISLLEKNHAPFEASAQ